MAIAPITGMLRKHALLNITCAIGGGVTAGYAYWTVARIISGFFTIHVEPYTDYSPAYDTVSSFLQAYPETCLEVRYRWCLDILNELAGLHLSDRKGIRRFEVRLTADDPPRAILEDPDIVLAASALPKQAMARSVAVLLSTSFSQSRAENGFPPILASVIHECLMAKRSVDDARDILWHYRTATERDGSVDWTMPPPWVPVSPPNVTNENEKNLKATS
ncbi:hypothetical protein P7C70_g3076, partial [Phenoliferia sp. Uapishka_3]